MQAYQESLEGPDANPMTHIYIACCLFYLGQYKEAEEAAIKGPAVTLQVHFLLSCRAPWFHPISYVQHPCLRFLFLPTWMLLWLPTICAFPSLAFCLLHMHYFLVNKQTVAPYSNDVLKLAQTCGNNHDGCHFGILSTLIFLKIIFLCMTRCAPIQNEPQLAHTL